MLAATVNGKETASDQATDAVPSIVGRPGSGTPKPGGARWLRIFGE